MAYDTERKKFSKQHFWYVELEVDGQIVRLCEDVAPLPRGFDGIPTLASMPSVNPAQIDLKGGIGVRAKCNVSFKEHQDYTVYGTLSDPVRFWSRWRAENPYYLGKRISIFSGYINNGVYSLDNFVRRDYIIETFSQTAGGVTITGKDPLKLASNDRAKAPRESNGSLVGDIGETALTFNLQPSGIGDTEYPASDGIIRIGDEVMTYTTRTGDSISGLTRGAFNTEISDHSENDTVQVCLRYEGLPINEIVEDLLTTYANVDASYIPSAQWAAEVDDAFITSYSTLITEPEGVQDLLEEFAQSAPHYIYYDERVNQIQLKALRPPPVGANVYTWEGNFLQGSTSVTDKQDMRISTVICRFGIINPVKDLGEVSNYRAAYVREDTDSVTNYGQRAYKIVNSRWIDADNQTAAVLMSARIGRRFSEAPRMLNLAMDAKDADVWAGDSVKLETDLIEQSGGGFPQLDFQVISASEKQNFEYSMLEHTYGPALPQDQAVEDPNTRIVYISGEQDQLKDTSGNVRTLRELYEDVYPSEPLEAQFDVRFIIESNGVVGSSDNTQYAIKTGSWPELDTPPLIVNNGLIVGTGGTGGSTASGGVTDGGPAILLQNDIRLNNLNIIGGGGGGGREFVLSGAAAAGGGGAGYFNGQAGTGTGFSPPSEEIEISFAQDGTNTTGGDGGFVRGSGGQVAEGGDGGDLGQAGGLAGGAAGAAIDGNGFSVLYIEEGSIFGTKAPALIPNGQPRWSASGNTIDTSTQTTTVTGVASFGGDIYALSNGDTTLYRYDGTTYAYDNFSATIAGAAGYFDLHYDSATGTRWISAAGSKVIEYNSSWVATGNEILTSTTVRGAVKVGSIYYVVEGSQVNQYDETFTATGNSFAHGLTNVRGLATDGTRLYYVEEGGEVHSGGLAAAASRFEISTGLVAQGVDINGSKLLVCDSDTVIEYDSLT